MIDLEGLHIVYDGEVHRFHVDGDKRGSKNGWYIAKTNGFMVYSSWKYGNEKHYIKDNGQHLSYGDRMSFKKQLAIENHARFLFQQDAAKDLMAFYYDLPYGEHPYLAKKGFAERKEKKYKNAIVIPAYSPSISGAAITSLQYIWATGKKRFEKNCRIKGALGIVNDYGEESSIKYLCEGFSTALTIAEAANALVYFSFSASNLMLAYETLTQRNICDKIIVCADNDRQTAGNPGVSAAIEVEDKHGCNICIPDLSECLPEDTDFNDLMLEKGIDEVRRQILGTNIGTNNRHNDSGTPCSE